MMKLHTEDQLRNAAILASKLHALQVDCKLLDDIQEGPVVSIYKVLPTGRTKVSNLEALASDFAMALSVEDVVVKRLPGEANVSIFVPNKERHHVAYTEIASELWRRASTMVVPVALGIDHTGSYVIEDLSTLPHLLVAGSTGGGKSTLLNSILTGISLTCKPDKVQFILSDTKGVEFQHFLGVPHLLFEPATTVQRTIEQMDWLIMKTERRLGLFAKASARNITEYRQQGRALPSIVLVIDELADLLTDRSKPDAKGPTVGKIAGDKLEHIVRRSRASGAYVIAATQRPSVNIVSGTIKANFPARATFRLPSEADSRTIIGEGGAEHLLSFGDMLFLSGNGTRRVHAPYATQSDLSAALEMALRLAP